jgi:hypothetical protein
MSTRLQTLLILADAIDIKCEKLESALTEARKSQLAEQLAFLTQRFQSDYAEVLESGKSFVQSDSRFHDKLNRLVRSEG